MKKLLLLCSVFFACSVMSQEKAPKAEGTETQISKTQKALQDSLCNCIGKEDLSKVKSMDDIMLPFGVCMMKPKTLELMMEFGKEKGIDLEDEKGFKKIGEIIGRNLGASCEAFQKVILRVMLEQAKDKKD